MCCSANYAEAQQVPGLREQTSGGTNVQPADHVSTLAIAVRARQIVKGLPDSLIVTLTNVGKSPMELPEPDRCGNVPDGTVNLRMRFTAAPDNHAQMHGSGCFNDFGRSPLAERRKQWKRLLPGEHLDTWVLVESQGPGRYTLWIEYTPPYLSAEERQALMAEGVLFPDKKLTSGAADFVEVP